MHHDWEGGRHQGLAWRRLAIVVAVAAAVVAAGWVAVRSEEALRVQTDRNPAAAASEEPDVVLQPPVRVGAGWGCPDDHPVLAFESGLYYPPAHPDVPAATTRPDGCFLSSRWAASGGYELAPAPPDAVVAGSLYLVPTVSPTIEACAAVAAVVGFSVPCPTRLPAPGVASSCLNACVFEGAGATPGVVIEQRGFLQPADWCDSCEPHIVIAAVHDRTPAELISCGPEMAREVRDGAVVTGYYSCGPGPEWVAGSAGSPHEGHTLLITETGAVTYAVSMEGRGPQVRAVLSALRTNIEIVEAE